ncbi:ABC transporter permease [Amycolatopsis sp. GM8]|uniref:ABC transporter permease n=1 Tax=Amycolatopsis sp. GM8 TaxID=2896530 RepID=UPI001F01F095|nr:ABC transporter permease subunit [Amycolatopsis sp. GM8]
MTILASRLGATTEPETGGPDRRSSRARPGTAWLWPLVGVIGFVLVWALLAALVRSSAVLPGPWEVAKNFAANFNGSPALKYLGLDVTSYVGNLGYTGSIVLSGWLIGAVIGVVTGLASARTQWVRNLVEPVTTVFGVVPILVAAPFALVWFGTSTTGKFLLIVFFSAATVLVVAQSAALALPLRYEEYAATLGGGSSARLRRVVFPATLTTTLTGLRAALGQAWGLEVVAELLGAPAGIGRAIAVRAGTGDIASVIALILALGILALLCDAVLSLIVRQFAQWQTDKEPS